MAVRAPTPSARTLRVGVVDGLGRGGRAAIRVDLGGAGETVRRRNPTVGEHARTGP